MDPKYPDIIPELKKWLQANEDTLVNRDLWSKRDYAHWLRYDFYLKLSKVLNDTAGVGADVALGRGGNDPVADLLLTNNTPKDARSLVVRFVCERFSGNAGTYEEYVQRVNDEFQKYSKPESRDGYEDVGKLMVVFISEPPSDPTGEGYPKDPGALIVKPTVEVKFGESLYLSTLEAEFDPLP